ncbi:hypothetical protein ES703_92548 [subsurface metagenome]
MSEGLLDLGSLFEVFLRLVVLLQLAQGDAEVVECPSHGGLILVLSLDLQRLIQ